ncbi:hypothetical protein EJB05_50166, partial [Eragrostis curvula]
LLLHQTSCAAALLSASSAPPRRLPLPSIFYKPPAPPPRRPLAPPAKPEIPYRFSRAPRRSPSSPQPRARYCKMDIPATAGFALAASIIALHLLSVLDYPGTTTTTAPAPPALLNGALQVLAPLAAMEGLVAAVAFIYRHMNRADGAGVVNRRIPKLVTTILCASVGLLLFLLFVQPAGGADDDGAQARELIGVLAVRALPATATATFFSGVMLIYVHVGNAAGAGVGADAGAGPVPAPAVNLLAKITLGAAVAVVSLMAMALNTN